MEDTIQYNDVALDEVSPQHNVYSPTSLLGMYADSVSINRSRTPILLKGMLIREQGSRTYGGYYFCSVKSEYDSRSIKVQIPEAMMSRLHHNHIYTFRGYIDKKITLSSIELQLRVDDFMQSERNKISDSELRQYEVVKRKNHKGFRNLEETIRKAIYSGRKVKVINVYGSSSIVDKDFAEGLGEAVVHFEIRSMRCSITSKSDLIMLFRRLSLEKADVVALVRGGGGNDQMSIYDDPDIAESILQLPQAFVSAIGHTVNETLLDKIADAGFPLPLAYGRGLKDWVGKASEQMNNSRAVLIEQVTRNVRHNFEMQISSYEKQLKDAEEFRRSIQQTQGEAIRARAEAMNYENRRKIYELNNEINEVRKSNRNSKLLTALIAIIIGVVTGLLLPYIR